MEYRKVRLFCEPLYFSKWANSSAPHFGENFFEIPIPGAARCSLVVRKDLWKWSAKCFITAIIINLLWSLSQKLFSIYFPTNDLLIVIKPLNKTDSLSAKKISRCIHHHNIHLDEWPWCFWRGQIYETIIYRK